MRRCLFAAIGIATCAGCSPAAETQFWLNWAVQVAVALATLAAIIVALFKEALIARVYPPQLQAGLRNTTGKLTGGPQRWYHIRVTNGRRWSPVHGVRVMLVRVDEKDAAGGFREKWNGLAPMRWMSHLEAYPERVVGAEEFADLCVCEPGNQQGRTPSLKLAAIAKPDGLVDEITPNNPVRLWLRAQGITASSADLCLEIHWDGQWATDDATMLAHLVITEVAPTRAVA